MHCKGFGPGASHAMTGWVIESAARAKTGNWKLFSAAITTSDRSAYRCRRRRAYTTLTFPASPNAHSSAARSHFAKSAAASYVLCKNSISVASGSRALRTAS